MKRQIVVIGQYAYIPLTQGYTAIIDAADVPLVEGYEWNAFLSKHTTYVRRRTSVGGKLRNVWLHRVIAQTPDGLDTDHVDGDGLNNTRGNLRIVTSSQNQCNQRRRDCNTSGHKGVSWYKRNQQWRVQIAVNNRKTHIGYFPNIDDAVAAYEKASMEFHGEFGRTA